MKKLLALLLLVVLTVTGCSFFKNNSSEKPQGSEKPKTEQRENPKGETARQKDYYIGLNAPVKGVKDWVYRYRPYDVVLLQKMDAYKVLLVSQGEKNSPGYQVKVDKVEKTADKWLVTVTLKQPATEDYSGKAVFPYAVISIKDDGKPVEVVKTGGPNGGQEPMKLVEIPAGQKLGVSKNFIVFTPFEGEKVNSPVTIKGKARVFEATFRITMEDGHIQLAQKQSIMSDAGAPAWGNFEVTLPYAKPTSPGGSIIFSYENMANGDIIDDLILPVKVQ